MENTLPWVEKYRPTNFDDIVLDDYNRIILNNIINTNCFHNLLFYGPPGTGKTTTIINLLKKYQEYNNEKGKDLIIHLNASDERGIDIIRNQIQSFVESKTLFNKGRKFIILDEVDYMTKNAQQALRYLINNYKCNIHFCLICNYISKIDNSLREEFINIHFNELPKEDIFTLLKNIINEEKINISDNSIIKLQNYFNSDIRSMINYLQSNQMVYENLDIIDNKVFHDLLDCKSLKKFSNMIYNISIKFNISRDRLIYKLLQYRYNFTNDEKYLKIIISCLHDSINIDLLIKYIFHNL